MRLLNSDRDGIVDTLLDRGFTAAKKELTARENELALVVYRLIVSEATEKAADAFNETNPGMVQVTAFVYAMVDDHSKKLFLAHRRPIGTTNRTADLGDETRLAIAKLLTDKADHDLAVKNARQKAYAVLSNIYTFEKLERDWPDVIPIAREFISMRQPVANLPAVPVADLNAIFDLPPAETELAA